MNSQGYRNGFRVSSSEFLKIVNLELATEVETLSDKIRIIKQRHYAHVHPVVHSFRDLLAVGSAGARVVSDRVVVAAAVSSDRNRGRRSTGPGVGNRDVTCTIA